MMPFIALLPAPKSKSSPVMLLTDMLEMPLGLDWVPGSVIHSCKQLMVECVSLSVNRSLARN